MKKLNINIGKAFEAYDYYLDMFRINAEREEEAQKYLQTMTKKAEELKKAIEEEEEGRDCGHITVKQVLRCLEKAEEMGDYCSDSWNGMKVIINPNFGKGETRATIVEATHKICDNPMFDRNGSWFITKVWTGLADEYETVKIKHTRESAKALLDEICTETLEYECMIIDIYENVGDRRKRDPRINDDHLY